MHPFLRGPRLCVFVVVLAGCGCATKEPGAGGRIQQALMEREVGGVEPLSSRIDSAEVRSGVTALVAQPLTPEAASRIALVNNRDLRVSLAAADYAEADLIQAAKLPNPEFTASTRWPSGGGAVTKTIAVSFDIFDALLIPLRTRMAKDELTAAEQNGAHQALVLIGETQIAWHRLATLEEWRVRLAAFHLEDQARLRILGQAGSLARAHAAQEEGETREELARTDAALVVARERLNLLMGFGEAPRWRMAGTGCALPSAQANPQAWESLALTTRLDLAALRMEAELIRQGRDLSERTRWLPLGVRVGVESERQSSGRRVTGPTIRLGLPVFDQGQADALRLRTALDQAENRVASMEAGIRSQIRVAVAQTDAARRAAETCGRVSVPQAAKIWAGLLRSSNQGGAGPLALHVARRDLIAATRREIESRYEYWRARVELSMALRG